MITLCVLDKDEKELFLYKTSERFIVPLLSLFLNKCVRVYNTLYFNLMDLDTLYLDFILRYRKTKKERKGEITKIIKHTIKRAKIFQDTLSLPILKKEIYITYKNERGCCTLMRKIKINEFRKFVAYFIGILGISISKGYELYKEGLKNKELFIYDNLFGEDEVEALYRIRKTKSIEDYLFNIVCSYGK